MAVLTFLEQIRNKLRNSFLCKLVCFSGLKVYLPGLTNKDNRKSENFLVVLHCVKSIRIWSFSGPYFLAFQLNMERYSVFLCIQPEWRKIRSRKTPNRDTFLAVLKMKQETE